MVAAGSVNPSAVSASRVRSACGPVSNARAGADRQSDAAKASASVRHPIRAPVADTRMAQGSHNPEQPPEAAPPRAVLACACVGAHRDPGQAPAEPRAGRRPAGRQAAPLRVSDTETSAPETSVWKTTQ